MSVKRRGHQTRTEGGNSERSKNRSHRPLASRKLRFLQSVVTADHEQAEIDPEDVEDTIDESQSHEPDHSLRDSVASELLDRAGSKHGRPRVFRLSPSHLAVIKEGIRQMDEFEEFVRERRRREDEGLWS